MSFYYHPATATVRRKQHALIPRISTARLLTKIAFIVVKIMEKNHSQNLRENLKILKKFKNAVYLSRDSILLFNFLSKVLTLLQYIVFPIHFHGR